MIHVYHVYGTSLPYHFPLNLILTNKMNQDIVASVLIKTRFYILAANLSINLKF